ncbi:MAG: hypothetical protein LBT01_04335 [Spirochaetaceae bacterium]|jgi:hypothetical protein|nr:hypothetical protein [Spirochaetaceae bacterium]
MLLFHWRANTNEKNTKEIILTAEERRELEVFTGSGEVEAPIIMLACSKPTEGRC